MAIFKTVKEWKQALADHKAEIRDLKFKLKIEKGINQYHEQRIKYHKKVNKKLREELKKYKE